MVVADFIEPLAGPAPTGAPANAFFALLRWAFPAKLSEEERALLDLLRRSARFIGAPLLEARSREDLEERLELAVAGPDLMRLNREASPAALSLPVSGARTPSEPTTGLVQALGYGPAAMLQQCSQLVLVAVSVMVQQIAKHPDGLAAIEFPHDVLDLLATRGVHSTIKRCMLDGMISTAALLGIAHAVLEGHALPPWLALALVETFRGGLYQHVRLLASFPSVSVPVSVIPAADRLDLEALSEHAAEAEARIAALVADVGPAGRVFVDVPDAS